MKQLIWLVPCLLVACASNQPKAESRTESQKAMAQLAPKKDGAAAEANKTTEKAGAEAKASAETATAEGKTKAGKAALGAKASAEKAASEKKAAAEESVAEKKDAVEKAASTVTCKHGKETRTLAINPKDGGCEVNYTKGGETKSIANSANGLAHCEKSVTKIKANLEKGGFTCE